MRSLLKTRIESLTKYIKYHINEIHYKKLLVTMFLYSGYCHKALICYPAVCVYSKHSLRHILKHHSKIWDIYMEWFWFQVDLKSLWVVYVPHLSLFNSLVILTPYVDCLLSLMCECTFVQIQNLLLNLSLFASCVWVKLIMQ